MNPIEANTLYHCTKYDGHHDARFLAKDAAGQPIVVCVQIRHGEHRTASELSSAQQNRLGQTERKNNMTISCLSLEAPQC